jgi:signal transduction histidine kinase
MTVGVGHQAPGGTARRLLARLSAAARRHPTLVDAALAALVFVATAAPELVRAAPAECGCRPTPWWAWPVFVAEALPLVWRRRIPFLVGFLVGVPTAVHGGSDLLDPPVAFAGLLALYTAAAHAEPAWKSRVAALFAGTGIAITLLLDGTRSDVLDWTFTVLTFAAAWILGDNARTRRLYARQVEQRAREQDERRAAEAARELAAERTRLARELHDVVAHHVSMMVVQAEAGGVVTHDPQLAGRTFDGIASTGRQALVEMRRLLGILRAGADPAAPTAPQPGLAAVPDLVRQVRAAGLPVDVTVEGEPAHLAPGVDLSAYRIVQEALTNTLRHAGRASATVSIAYRPDAVELEVLDDGTGAPAGHDGGNGLQGMRERVALFGGRFEAGPRPDGGFAVRALLPRQAP